MDSHINIYQFMNLTAMGYKDLLGMLDIRKGFEPLTHGLENRCSIQLSYQGISFFLERQR
jgi:hypothetical protein